MILYNYVFGRFRYWAIVVPCLFVFCIVSVLLVYFSINLTLTPPLSDLKTVTGQLGIGFHVNSSLILFTVIFFKDSHAIIESIENQEQGDSSGLKPLRDLPLSEVNDLLY